MANGERVISHELSFLAGGGEMGERIRAFNWSTTPLGPPAGWPKSLKVAVRIMLASRQPIWIGWGPELIYLYNDPYKSIIGGKHPKMLGQPTRVVWSEIWDVIGPMLSNAIAGDAGTYVEAQMLIMERSGYPEETYYTYSYTPIPDDDGGNAGIICANTDDTRRVIGERQLSLLRELATATADQRTWKDVCLRAAKALEYDPQDIPFAALYMRENDDRALSLIATTAGIDAGHAGAPRTIAIDDERAVWPVGQSLQTAAPIVVDNLAALPDLPTGAWGRPPSRAAVLPLTSSGGGARTGVLVVGASPYRLLNGEYLGFLNLIAGQISAAIAVAEAYEAEKARAESLAELDRAKTAFFSNISHEFRTPLTLMLGSTEDAIAVENDSEQLERLDLVHRNARRLQKLANTLLEFSRIGAGRVRATYRPTDLSRLTVDLASVFRSAIERAGMTLVIECPPVSGRVYVDTDMYEKIVLNLLSNAFKHTFEGEIRVGLRDVGDAVEVDVQDTGVGIAQHELPRLFERFHRVEGARSRTFEGSGIGLALVNELVKLNGGAIRVESEVGRGSRFTVRLPKGSSHLPKEHVVEEDAQRTLGPSTEVFVDETLRWLPENRNGTTSAMKLEDDTPEGSATDPLAGGVRGRVLLADDNSDMREYLTRLLTPYFSVQSVPDGECALRAARESRPNLILTDVMMPNLDGFGLLKAVRADALLRSTPVLMLSARAGEESRLEGLTAGANDYLVKPFSGRELIARVSAHIQLAHLRQEAQDKLNHILESERAARAEAERSGRIKDEFLATLSHELRTPLNAILGWTHLLRRAPDSEENVRQGLAVIERNARVQIQLVSDLLDMSRIISGKMRLDVQRVELPILIEAALESVRPAAEAKDVRIQCVLEPVTDPMHGDPARLQQIVWNLLSNAVKFTPRGGRVQVVLARVNSHVEISISDTGKGIKPEFLPHVFERFRQADSSSAREHGGLGLGLAIVKQLVELHGGTVHAKSPGEGQGATFSVHLPLAVIHTSELESTRIHPKSNSLSPAEGDQPDLAGVKVLVVDDEADAREIVKRVLEDCSASVILANSSAEALKAYESEKPDVLISDIGMPGEDGYTLIRAIRKRGGRIPAAALTAFARSEDRTRALLAGYHMHLSKPVEPSELLATVATLAYKTGHEHK